MYPSTMGKPYTLALFISKLLFIHFFLLTSQGTGKAEGSYSFRSATFRGLCRYGDAASDSACKNACESEGASSGACTELGLCQCSTEDDVEMPDVETNEPNSDDKSRKELEPIQEEEPPNEGGAVAGEGESMDLDDDSGMTQRNKREWEPDDDDDEMEHDEKRNRMEDDADAPDDQYEDTMQEQKQD